MSVRTDRLPFYSQERIAERDYQRYGTPRAARSFITAPRSKYSPIHFINPAAYPHGWQSVRPGGRSC